jgi:undecaprenyl-diphosphatase
VFLVAIQAGAILAVCWEYRARLIHLFSSLLTDKREQRLAVNVVVAFVPAAILGVLFKEAIESVLFAPVPVACAFAIGGLIILWVEKKHASRTYRPRVATIDDITWIDAAKIGCAQCLALIPGTSRSGATIIGSLLFGLSRTAATEFSFFLAMPTVIGATVYSLYKARHQAAIGADAPLYVTASVVAFLSALVCVRWLLRYVSSHDFRAFAWYRIAFGALILLTAYLGLVDWNA